MTRRRRRPAASRGGWNDLPDSYDGSNDVAEAPPAPVVTSTPSERVQAIVARAQAARAASLNAGLENGDVDQAEDINPSSRMEQVRSRAPEFEREYRLKLIHRLLMRKVPLDEIAAQLDLSVRTVQRERLEIYNRLKKEASRLDINALLGETMAFYGELGAMALRIATAAKTPVPHRLAAIRTSMSSKKELGQWFALAGVFEQLKYVPEEEVQSGDLAKLIAISEKLLLSDDDEGFGELDDLKVDDLLDENVEMLL